MRKKRFSQLASVLCLFAAPTSAHTGTVESPTAQQGGVEQNRLAQRIFADPDQRISSDTNGLTNFQASTASPASSIRGPE